MRIAAVVNVFPQLTEAFVRLQLLELQKRGQEISLFALSRGSGDPSPFVPEYVGHRWSKIPKRISTDLHGSLAAQSAIRALRGRHLRTWARDAAALFIPPRLPSRLGESAYDVIHCHFGHVGKEVAVAFRKRRTPLIVSFYGFDAYRLPTSWGGDMFHALFRKAAAVISLGPAMDERLIALGCPLSLLRRVPIGVETSFFTFSNAVAVTDRPIRLLTVARLVEKKGLSVGIQSAIALGRLTGRPVEYHIAGEGPLEARLKREAASSPPGIQVRFLGSVDTRKMRGELEACDVCVVPSVTAGHGDREGTPVIALQAMAVGRPVVTSTNGDLRYILGEGDRGTLVDEGDVPGFARATQDCLVEPNLDKLLGARRYVEEFHSPQVIGDSLSAIYRRTLS